MDLIFVECEECWEEFEVDVSDIEDPTYSDAAERANMIKMDQPGWVCRRCFQILVGF